MGGPIFTTYILSSEASARSMRGGILVVTTTVSGAGDCRWLFEAVHRSIVLFPGGRRETVSRRAANKVDYCVSSPSRKRARRMSVHGDSMGRSRQYPDLGYVFTLEDVLTDVEYFDLDLKSRRGHSGGPDRACPRVAASSSHRAGRELDHGGFWRQIFTTGRGSMTHKGGQSGVGLGPVVVRSFPLASPFARVPWAGLGGDPGR